MTDIRVGDLVKFTNRQTPETTFTSRVRVWSDDASYYSSKALGTVHLPDWDFEVLDRPLPPIDEELLLACREAYAGAPVHHAGPFRESWVKVINTVREYDRTHNTEESK